MSAAVLDESGEDGGGGGGEEEEELTNLSWLHNCGALSLSNGIGGGTNSSKVTEFLQGSVGQKILLKTFRLAQ